MQIQRIHEQKRDHRDVASKNDEIVAVYKSRERQIQKERERERDKSTDIGTRNKMQDPESRLRNRVRPRVSSDRTRV